MSKVVALIPARGGSKGLPGKNTRLLCGKPLIAHTIEAALQCSQIHEVYVSTDDPAIADVAEASGACVPFLRPLELATDSAQALDVIRHFLDWYRREHGEWPEVFVLLQPTSPLRQSRHIAQALEQYQRLPKPASVVSVSPEKPLAWQGTMDAKGKLIRYAEIETTNRQESIQNYSINGAIYCTSPWQVYESGFLHGSVYAMVMPKAESIDIDTVFDFQVAEMLMAQEPFTVTPV